MLKLEDLVLVPREHFLKFCWPFGSEACVFWTRGGECTKGTRLGRLLEKEGSRTSNPKCTHNITSFLRTAQHLRGQFVAVAVPGREKRYGTVEEIKIQDDLLTLVFKDYNGREQCSSVQIGHFNVYKIYNGHWKVHLEEWKGSHWIIAL